MKLHLKFTKNVQHSMFVFLFTSLTFSLLSSVNYRQPIHLEAAIPSSGINATNLTDIEVNAYYQQANVDGLTGEALKSALHNLIDDHSTVSYDGLKTAMKITDRDWASSPLTSAELSTYTHNDDPNLDVFYSNSTIKSSNIGSSENTWNREHTWAKSHGNFGESSPAGTDLHHLRASEAYYNSKHGSLDFGDTGWTPPYVNDKGDIARMIFYMPVRYFEFISVADPKLEILNSKTSGNTASSTVTGKMGILDDLLAWHYEDPVDDFEIHRNNLIYNNYQYNRNPFVDHPEWVDMIYDSSYSGPGASTAAGTSSVGDGVINSPLTSITIDTTDVQTSFDQGEAFNSLNLIVTAHYEDSTSQVISTYTTSPTSGSSLNTSGNQSVTVTYSENGISKSATYTISVSVKTVIGISVYALPTITQYAVNETFNSNGLLVQATYDDNATGWINDYVLNPANGSELGNIGNQTIQITAAGQSTSFTVAVGQLSTLLATPSITTVALGETYVDNDIELMATYSAPNITSFTRNIETFSITGEVNTAALGTYIRTVSYDGLSTTFSVKVTNVGANAGENEPASNLFISEYVEGSSNNKAIEIYNGTGASIDLGAFKIKIYANGNTTPINTFSLASTTLANEATYVVVNSSASAALQSAADLLTGSLSHNGNDVIELVENNVVIERIGRIGDSNVFAEDVTLVRKSTIAEPTTIYDASAWDTYPSDTFTNLGTHTFSGGSATLTPLEQATAFSVYFLELTSDVCVLNGTTNQSALMVVWQELANEYAPMAGDSKDIIFNAIADDSSSDSIAQAKARYIYIIEKYQAEYTNFLEDAEGTKLMLEVTHFVPSTSLEISTHLLLLIILIIFFSTIVYYFYRTRQKQ